MSSSEDFFVISPQAVVTYSWVVYGVVCQIINIFGIVTNIINIFCFVKQGFKESVNISFLGLSVCDLGSLTTMLLSCIFLTPAVMAADLPFQPIDVMYMTSGMQHLSFTRVGSCITAMITLERCLCVTAPLKIKSILTKKRSTVITVLISVIFFCTSAPIYVVNRLDLVSMAVRNTTVLAMVSSSNRQEVEMITFIINSFCVPFSAFIIIVTCTVILVFQLHSKTQWRQKTNTSSQVDRVSMRNQKTSKMVVMISTLFIICFVPNAIIAFTAGFLPEMSVNGQYLHLSMVLAGFGYTMESINSSMNICIYFRMSSRYRDTYNELFQKYKSEGENTYQ